MYVYICMYVYIYIYSNMWYRCLWNKHSSRCRACFLCPDPATLISKLTPRHPTAANRNERILQTDCTHFAHVREYHIDIRGDGGSPTLITTRMTVYFTDTDTPDSIQYITTSVSAQRAQCARRSLLLPAVGWQAFRQGMRALAARSAQPRCEGATREQTWHGMLWPLQPIRRGCVSVGWSDAPHPAPLFETLAEMPLSMYGCYYHFNNLRFKSPQ